jgi:serine phosphatase RsbU (regulator of sigma subunit)
MPLGLMAGIGYEEQEASLSEGDSVLFYSDGLVEAHDPEVRCSASLGCGRSLPSTMRRRERWGDFFMEELSSYLGEGWEQEDDITLLTLRRSASLS